MRKLLILSFFLPLMAWAQFVAVHRRAVKVPLFTGRHTAAAGHADCGALKVVS